MRVRVVGIGPGGVDQLTIEAVEALRSVSAYLVVEKREDDPLVAAREAIIARHVPDPPRMITVRDPERDRSARVAGDEAAYRRAVADWHAARAERFAAALDEADGDVAILVWGDPAFYDSTLRILDRVAAHRRLDVDVVPGVSSLQLLAARHAIVLHEIGRPLHLTTGRKLPDAVERGEGNIAAMLLSSIDAFAALGDWTIWWGANLGTAHEALAHGTVAEVLPEIRAARDRVKYEAGWIMDLALLRKPS
ncbi:precorrin-6A synthase (deacetylating) [Aeromicrobium sp. PE09-221]|uniref:precorrin-6A synthase (deacetylating) n=1 Tax=Aeromicrobium sp. PE09-221 TaxID=1898043 RepID=UPI000B3E8A02|nr:precorrin-6A synthase (deacetylating) [Aeromicrobium sp. PE09-221]OUZ07550.1 precorrin-6A synthase (deacetylating) [Aeromicrobium sp. PE09-221]